MMMKTVDDQIIRPRDVLMNFTTENMEDKR